VVVRAENAYGTGWPSDSVSFTTELVPATPTASGSSTARSITVGWTSYSDSEGVPASGYMVYCRGYFQTGGDGSAWTYAEQTLDVATDDATLQHTFEDLTPGQAYVFWATASISGVDTGPSYVSAPNGTAQTEPDTPLLVSVVSGSTNQSRTVNVRTVLPYHNLACVEDSSCSSTMLSEVEVTISPTGSSGATFTTTSSLQVEQKDVVVDGLAPAAAYSIQVRVRSTSGWSAPSAAITHVTCDEEPTPPTGLSAAEEEKTNASVTLRWSAPNDGGREVTKYK